MIRMDQVTKAYGNKENRVPVLKGVSLTIQDEDYVVILGASGSGKSTLLQVMSGLEKADGGQVFYDDQDIELLSEEALTRFRRDNVGFIFQQYYLLPGLTVDKNVKLGADLAGNKEYRDMIDAVGLGEKLSKLPGELSGGEQQRVAVARALSKKPKVLFLDEPTGALDEATGRQILDYISKLREEYHFTIIMVTHNDHIAEMANTVIHMNSGKIVDVRQNDTPKGAYEIEW